jgi:hypothetical protein
MDRISPSGAQRMNPDLERSIGSKFETVKEKGKKKGKEKNK